VFHLASSINHLPSPLNGVVTLGTAWLPTLVVSGLEDVPAALAPVPARGLDLELWLVFSWPPTVAVFLLLFFLACRSMVRPIPYWKFVQLRQHNHGGWSGLWWQKFPAEIPKGAGLSSLTEHGMLLLDCGPCSNSQSLL
jgi:hypothetical protein